MLQENNRTYLHVFFSTFGKLDKPEFNDPCERNAKKKHISLGKSIIFNS